MRKDAGVDGDAQRIGQLGWMLFLKIYSDLELETELSDSKYQSPTPKGLRWQDWADEDSLGKDALTGDALTNFVNNELFPGLKDLDLGLSVGQARERGALLISVFDDAYNYMKNGTLLRQVINKINQDIDYNSVETRHLFGEIYEQILKDLQSAGNAGEYYTPRAVTQFAIDIINPQLGEIVLDPACGTGGFLTCAFEHLKQQVKTPDQLSALKNSIKGVEKKQLPHTLCATNMMVHGIEVPSNILNDNTLSRPLKDYSKKDQVDIIVTNPPFGGVEEDGIENNFPSEFRTRETADLFLVLVVELLKPGGRAAIVLPDGTLFGEGIKSRIKKKLLEECNLHTIVRLPKSVFSPYTGIATNVLFLTKGEPTKEVWYYEHTLPKGVKAYNKSRPMKLSEFNEEKSWWENREETEYAWKVDIEDIRANNFNLDRKNPNKKAEVHESPAELLNQYLAAGTSFKEIEELLRSSLEISLDDEAKMRAKILLENFAILAEAPNGIEKLRESILVFATQKGFQGNSQPRPRYPLSQVCDVSWGNLSLTKSSYEKNGKFLAVSAAGGDGRIGHAEHKAFTPVLSAIGAKCGTMFMPTEDFTAIKNTMTLTPHQKMIDPWYLLYSIRGAQLPRRGSAQPFISKLDIEKFEVVVPSLDEQKQIVSRIDELMEYCNQLERQLAIRQELGVKFANSVVADRFS
jgi:type I restriction enzyme M protein